MTCTFISQHYGCSPFTVVTGATISHREFVIFCCFFFLPDMPPNATRLCDSDLVIVSPLHGFLLHTRGTQLCLIELCTKYIKVYLRGKQHAVTVHTHTQKKPIQNVNVYLSQYVFLIFGRSSHTCNYKHSKDKTERSGPDNSHLIPTSILQRTLFFH